MANVTFEVIARKCALWCTPCRIEFLRAPGRQLGLSRGRVEPQKVCGRIIRTWRAASAVDWMYQIVEVARLTGFGVVEDGVAWVGDVAVDGAEVDVLDVDLVEDRGDDIGDVVDNTTSAVIAVGPLAAAGAAGGDAGLGGAELVGEGWGAEFIPVGRRPRSVADGGAFFVGGEEGCFFEAGPEGFAFGAEGFDGVRVSVRSCRLLFVARPLDPREEFGGVGPSFGESCQLGAKTVGNGALLVNEPFHVIVDGTVLATLDCSGDPVEIQSLVLHLPVCARPQLQGEETLRLSMSELGGAEEVVAADDLCLGATEQRPVHPIGMKAAQASVCISGGGGGFEQLQPGEGILPFSEIKGERGELEIRRWITRSGERPVYGSCFFNLLVAIEFDGTVEGFVEVALRTLRHFL